MLVLGIETSCDETAAAVVSVKDDQSSGEILSNIVLSQLDDHRPYGGVVPEIAARSHLDHMDSIVERALNEANLELTDLDAIAATTGPGLIGGVMVGMMTAKALALAANKPFVSVNHLEGHALTARLSEDVAFPYLLLLVSGGHCQILCVRGVGDYELYGSTIDDAVGEAFDKTAKLLGLEYPGGPNVEKAAASGDPHRFKLPRPMVGRPDCDFSFSGLKTAVRQQIEKLSEDERDAQALADICAGFQLAVGDVFADRCRRAMERFRAECGDGHALVVGGGVAANKALRAVLTDAAAAQNMRFVAPPVKLCTDNGAMIAWAGLERLRRGLTSDLNVAAKPRWPLDSLKID
ncbi:tRNA (adenosine(37)-N6)-threonylcarbamoyltransferase complex transferase subunit TsaD [Curvivirga aplysinae]|uniref:tRNA (adenosine(37)-N6)-threonylcarbamoyltransferase complex transferase subunit TsaD n=1 Tax=Curvivirga aplysinae TaxID=2529852 RepID=UPI0012BD4A69|nr:tRNA (adenosine(37)-N6)-threonylcarbamoyltransferase complex transferase subunit TsaD [Curvivirga aplysinae]MTI11227.1 tRNA (adenosine(37)-N6)-threonylcarbamoyltransferase complex transferase subunit TsaD [Curvivirga aplysinae]